MDTSTTIHAHARERTYMDTHGPTPLHPSRNAERTFTAPSHGSDGSVRAMAWVDTDGRVRIASHNGSDHVLGADGAAQR